MVLVFDDAHALKPPMVELVRAAWAPRRGRAAHGAHRSSLARPELLEEHGPTWGSTAANAVTLRLEPLPAGRVVALVRQAGRRPHRRR